MSEVAQTNAVTDNDFIQQAGEEMQIGNQYQNPTISKYQKHTGLEKKNTERVCTGSERSFACFIYLVGVCLCAACSATFIRSGACSGLFTRDTKSGIDVTSNVTQVLFHTNKCAKGCERRIIPAERMESRRGISNVRLMKEGGGVSRGPVNIRKFNIPAHWLVCFFFFFLKDDFKYVK